MPMSLRLRRAWSRLVRVGRNSTSDGRISAWLSLGAYHTYSRWAWNGELVDNRSGFGELGPRPRCKTLITPEVLDGKKSDASSSIDFYNCPQSIKKLSEELTRKDEHFHGPKSETTYSALCALRINSGTPHTKM